MAQKDSSTGVIPARSWETSVSRSKETILRYFEKGFLKEMELSYKTSKNDI
jgi:hypothetical protein